MIYVLIHISRPPEMCLHKDAIITIKQIEEGEETNEFFAAMGSRDRNKYHTLLKGKHLNIKNIF